ncbi:AraC family transcriptional regulator [Marinobacter segnicrescens]|uniref:AraC-type DNA-binding protein n=1 Tax=Marinobacter segnicrescens TaxID=430453 RepID=A0A1H9YKV6_9GAMM|nr:helix-turn-helix domain-containing protein [Marinobacter segnicrescens]SES69681.1 AraC-type DNA-binding protein [Marinobacter segnicrescens]
MRASAGESSNHLYIWDNRVLYTGPDTQPRYRCYGSAALVIGIDGMLQLHRQTHATEGVTTRCCVITPGLPVYLESDSPGLLVLFLDPFLHDLKALQRHALRQSHGILWDFDNQEQLAAMGHEVSTSRPPPQVVLAMLARLGLSHSSRLDPGSIDPRVARAVGLLRSKRMHNITTEDLASAVNLSVPRVIQLFRQYLGISAGKYRQWHRLHATTLAIAQGQSFTQAAVGSGFSDLAHFSNTFHSMLGIMPTSLLRARNGVQFHVDPQLASEGFSTLTGINSTNSTLC